MREFLPVILGTDINAYGVARAFHEGYGVTSICLGRKALTDTKNSKICEVRVREDFEDEKVFMETLLGLREEKKDIPLILISCSDGYTSLITKNEEELKEHYLFNYITPAMQEELENKKDFYNICEKYGLPYPKTEIITPLNKDDYKTALQFPVALKPNDSIEYVNIHFEGKKKAYKIKDEEELREVIEKIYDNGYTGELIAQDFIPGDTSAMYVLNAYVNRKGEVKMMCLGKCLLDEVLPLNIGNYNALMTMGDEEIYKTYEKFLKDIGYRGFANFDLKYDARDGKYKVFEINIRQGRSSYYMNAGGVNFVTYLVDDLLNKPDKPCHYAYDRGLWLYVDPSVLRKYVAKSDRPLAEKMLKKGYTFTQWYSKDKSLYRYMMYMRRRLSTIKYYKIYG